LTPASEHLFPKLEANILAQIHVGDGAKVTLEELSSSRNIQTFESIGEELEIRVF
jgi:hypothetical protein